MSSRAWIYGSTYAFGIGSVCACVHVCVCVCVCVSVGGESSTQISHKGGLAGIVLRPHIACLAMRLGDI